MYFSPTVAVVGSAVFVTTDDTSVSIPFASISTAETPESVNADPRSTVTDSETSEITGTFILSNFNPITLISFVTIA